MTPEAPPISAAILSFKESRSGLQTNAGFSRSFTRNNASAARRAPDRWKASSSWLGSTLLQASSWSALKTRAVDKPSLQIGGIDKDVSMTFNYVAPRHGQQTLLTLVWTRALSCFSNLVRQVMGWQFHPFLCSRQYQSRRKMWCLSRCHQTRPSAHRELLQDKLCKWVSLDL